MIGVPTDLRPVVKGLIKDPGDRTKIDNEHLYNFFKDIKCFDSAKNNSTDWLMKVINAMSCVFVPKHEVLFRIGDRGRHVYICISGRSQLFIANSARATMKNKKKDLEEKLQECQEDLKIFKT